MANRAQRRAQEREAARLERKRLAAERERREELQHMARMPEMILPAEFTWPQPNARRPVSTTGSFNDSGATNNVDAGVIADMKRLVQAVKSGRLSYAAGGVVSDTFSRPLTPEQVWTNSWEIPLYDGPDTVGRPEPIEVESLFMPETIPAVPDLPVPLFTEYVVLWILDHPTDSDSKYAFEPAQLQTRMAALFEHPEEGKPLPLYLPKRLYGTTPTLTDVVVTVRRLMARKWVVAHTAPNRNSGLRQVRITSAGVGALALVDRLQDLDAAIGALNAENDQTYPYK